MILRKKKQIFISLTITAIFLLASFLYSPLFAQNTTIGENKPDEKVKSGLGKQKVLLIPFDPKMYMSDIDRSINRETKMEFVQIRALFRAGIDNQLWTLFKPNYSVISLLKDTSRTKIDLQFIYRSTGYKYTVTEGKEKVSDQKKITNGQLTVAIQSDEERYMRTVINQPGLLQAMNKKYGAELFVFVSELDLKSTPAIDGIKGREASIHFTVYNLDGKQVGGGLAKSKFDGDLNDPKKIINKAFPSATKTIYTRSIPAPLPLGNKGNVPSNGH
jgi:hypothetical protein